MTDSVNREFVELRGFFETLAYRLDDSGYSIIRVRLDGTPLPKELKEFGIRKDGMILCQGYDLPTRRHVPYKFLGKVTTTRKGTRFQVIKSTPDPEENKNQVMAFLASLSGVGPATAAKIYRALGDAAAKKIEKDPSILLDVLPQATARKILTGYRAEEARRKVLDLILPYGGTAAQARRISEAWGLGADLKLKAEPYSVLTIKGFDFPFADRLALAYGMPPDSADRLRNAIMYALEEHERAGATMIRRELLYDRIVRILAEPPVSAAEIGKAAEYVVEKKYVTLLKRRDGIYAERTFTYRAEKRIAKMLAERAAYIGCHTAERYIPQAEKINRIALSEEQRDAVKMALSSSVMVITGGPGRGKTAVEKVICSAVKLYSRETGIALLAPTGKAARQMTASTGMTASTIDSKIGMCQEERALRRIEEDLVIVDEVSMVDIWHMDALLSNLKESAKLILIGDEDQLPSVGTGAVLHDILMSGVVPVARLTKNFRQGDGSEIARNADRINAGKSDLLASDAFRITAVSRISQEDAADLIEDAYARAVSEAGIGNVICLVPMHGGAAGTDAMNARLQRRMNPGGGPETAKRGMVFRKGDPVMHLKNDTKAGVVNGDVGFVKEIREDHSVVVDYYGSDVVYIGDDLDDLTLNYCSTIHKSQGSEYDIVITCLLTSHGPMLVRNLLYTAVTRAKRRVCLICEPEAVKKAAATASTETRATMLCPWLKYADELIRKRAEEENPFLESGAQ